MTCKKAEKQIAPFIAGNIDTKELEDFLEHIEECPSCKEELSIQYLVAVGMYRLEEGGSFDLQRELDAKLLAEKKRAGFRYGTFYSLYVAEIAAIAITLVGTLAAILLL